MAAPAPARSRRLIVANIPKRLIVADLSNDPTYAEVLFDTFGQRVIGLHISRSGDGMNCERRPVRHSAMLVYTIGRSYLIELLHAELQAGEVRFVDSPMMRRAFEQLAGLETELRESGTVYTCPPGQHDDLGISCAMLAWAARHPHLEAWVRTGLESRRPRFGGFAEFSHPAFKGVLDRLGVGDPQGVLGSDGVARPVRGQLG